MIVLFAFPWCTTTSKKQFLVNDHMSKCKQKVLTPSIDWAHAVLRRNVIGQLIERKSSIWVDMILFYKGYKTIYSLPW